MFRLLKSIARSIIHAICSDPEVTKLLEKHPRFFGFVKKRLTPDETFGLQLTIGIILTSLFAYFFFGLIRDLIGQDTIIESDISIINFIQLLRSPALDTAMMILTTLGRWHLVFAGAFVAAIVCVIGKRWHYLIALISTLVVSEVLVAFIHKVVEQARPPLVNTLIHESVDIFLSGHTFVAFSFYGLIIYFLYQAFHTWILRMLFLSAGFLIILLIGFSRIYLGIHWPADVFASFASAAALLTVIITILEIRRDVRMPYEDADDTALPAIRGATIIAILCWITWSGFAIRAFPLQFTQPIPEPVTQIKSEDIPGKLFETLPRYSETVLGKHTEPINVVLIGSESEIDDMFAQAGWTHSDPITIPNLWRALIASIKNTQDLHAPVTPMFWNTVPNTRSYLKSTPQNSVRERHHIRIWKTNMTTENGDAVLLGAASFDVDIKFKSKIIIPTHLIDPAIDKERDFVKDDLFATQQVEKVTRFKIVEPTLGKNVVGDAFFTDGQSYALFIRPNTQQSGSSSSQPDTLP